MSTFGPRTSEAGGSAGDRFRRWVFARHAHPISAWSRWATTPLLVLPLWTRRWQHAAAVSAWMAVNPVVTPPVRSERSFATRAILGEEQWLADPAQDTRSSVLNVVGSAGLAVAAVGAWTKRPLPTTAGLAWSMTVTMLSWRRYAELHDAECHGRTVLPRT
ncbi:hypothetical protein LY13_004400 [Prauserella aidingensis]|uniref:DUF6653 family protein n=1 Tax=Prauserella aidingensis TaxID=387890 RepID=UPI0020A29A5A|nr:DUF6653 family protein [Prauserella aidingensis]MCP2254876.1 hypothetical protein [Prauserella aidingensis]MCP2255621.1 hypothetical protein [Prauserella aidingensis]